MGEGSRKGRKRSLRLPSQSQVQNYLKQVTGQSKLRIRYFGPLHSYQEKKENHAPRQKKTKQQQGGIKTLGYGVPYLIVYEAKGRSYSSILSTLRIGSGFGHDYRADRVDNIVLSYDTWSRLPQHCRVQDFGAFQDGSLISLGASSEFFLLRPKVEGVEYYKDLDRILETGKLEEYDLPRAKALAAYLAKIHSKKLQGNPELYIRKLRDTVGHGECIFGLADSYPKQNSFLEPGELEWIEQKCVQHRWKLREETSRLCQVHGDFHPWNILFSENSNSPLKFALLDRSRGEWGEAADDVCALSINYLFYSLRKYGRLQGEFEGLFNSFLGTYLDLTKDAKLLAVLPLFYTFRALVIASPLWYPTLTDDTRRKIFNFAENILAAGSFDPLKVNDYFQGKMQLSRLA